MSSLRPTAFYREEASRLRWLAIDCAEVRLRSELLARAWEFEEMAAWASGQTEWLSFRRPRLAH